MICFIYYASCIPRRDIYYDMLLHHNLLLHHRTKINAFIMMCISYRTLFTFLHPYPLQLLMSELLLQ